MKIAAVLLPVFLLLGANAWSQSDAAPAATREEQIAAWQSQKDKAEQRVKDIVNQPITHKPRTQWAPIQIYSPGWFHDGAIKPDFNTVDVRSTQELPYERYDNVSSDLNPTEMFVGRELEFNSMTKYFYTDRSLPKKKLSETEMLEINRLYRIIGQSTAQLAQLQKEGSLMGRIKALGTVSAPEDFFNSIYATILELFLVAAVFTYFYRKWYVK